MVRVMRVVVRVVRVMRVVVRVVVREWRESGERTVRKVRVA